MPAKNKILSCAGCDNLPLRNSMPVEQLCTPCRKKRRHHEWCLANPGRNAANAQRWRDAGNVSVRSEASYEKQKAGQRRKYAEDETFRAKAKAVSRQRRIDKPETVRAENLAWLAANVDRVRKYHQSYNASRYSTDEDFRQRSLKAQADWRAKNCARDSQTQAWILLRPGEDMDQGWQTRLHSWQNRRCYVCNSPYCLHTMEHLLPKDRQGPTVPQNIVFSCGHCNFSRQNKLLHLEWNPSLIESDEHGLLVRYKIIVSALKDAGLKGDIAEDGSFVLSTGKRDDRPLFIVSTFAGSERNPGSFNGRIVSRLLAERPDAIVLFDREWYGRRDAVLNMLRAKMGIAERSASARQTEVVEVDSRSARAFLNEHHVMGFKDGTHYIGLSDGSALCGVGVFDATDERMYVCDRLAFRGHVPGGMSRIITALKRKHGDRPVMSFVDARYADGQGHASIGFEYATEAAETYAWVMPHMMRHRRFLSSDNKRSRNLLYYDPALSLDDNARANGIYRIWMPEKHRMVLK